MTFAPPLEYDPEQARIIQDCFADVPDAVDGLASVAGCSPYLARIMRMEQAWVKTVIDAPFAGTAQAILDGWRDLDADVGTALRMAKRRMSFLLAFHDLLAGLHPAEVTRWLTSFADLAVEAALMDALAAERGRGALDWPANPSAGLVVLAMGKHGAGELNYSSDIDLIVLYDNDVFDPRTEQDFRKPLIRATQRMVRTLSEATDFGYVFRTDLRLRPDPSVTPVCMSFDAAERYYESLGRTWERAAMIKARPAAGDLEAGARFLKGLEPFVWRRHLDFAAISAAQDMLLKIRDHKGLGGPMTFAGHDIKLGRGGIREIEFFAQTHQLIFGGRDRTLRVRRTEDTLLALVESQRIDETRAQTLIDNYWFLRRLEHRLQMLDDAQTHEVPQSGEKLERLAAFCGFEDVADLVRTVEQVLECTHALTALADEEKQTSSSADRVLDQLLTDFEAGWEARPALRNSRARGLYQKIRPTLLEEFGRATDPRDALEKFDIFLNALPAGVQLFSLFDANRNLLDLVIDICSTAPELGKYLGRNARVLDVVLDPDFYQALPDQEAYTRDLSEQLSDVQDFEAVLDVVRIWQKEQHFRVGVHLLRGLSEHWQVAASFSAVAEASIRNLLPRVHSQISDRYGSMPGAGMAVLAMGKLGTKTMTAQSDLDLIVIYDAESDAMSDGRKSVPAATYYGRLTQALISAMTVPTAQGNLYEIDMRLRPSGRKGPVATSLPSFVAYQHETAWTWEHLALTRARVVAGPEDLSQSLGDALEDIMKIRRDGRVLADDVQDMRARLFEARKDRIGNPWETKHGPGRMMDLELVFQMGALIKGLAAGLNFPDQAQALERAGWIDADLCRKFVAAWELLSAVQNVFRFIGPAFSADHCGPAQQALLERVSGVSGLPRLERKLAENAQWARSAIEELLGRQ